MHARLRPFRHRFSYRIFSLLVDLDDLARLAVGSRLLRHNRFGVFSILDRDHGPRDGTPIKPWVEALARDRGIDLSGGRVLMLTFPRVLGYVFNPISVFYAFDRSGAFRAVVYEVSNTFGDHHSYFLPVDPNSAPAGAATRQACDKRLHVSPFFGMAGGYRFRVSIPGDRLGLRIDADGADGPQMVATLAGRRRPLDDRHLLSAFLAVPFVTLKVIAAIHWQALRLWIKGARYHRRPRPPVEPVSP